MRSRITFLDRGGVFEVHIVPKREWLAVLFMAFWLALWTFVGFKAIEELMRQGVNKDSAFLLLWLAGWVTGEALVARTIVWQIGGKEILRIAGGTLSLKNDHLGLGVTRTFPLHEISDLRATGAYGSDMKRARSMGVFGPGIGMIAFVRRGKTHRFGAELEETEARGLVDRLRSYLPRTAFRELQRDAS